MSQKLYSSQLVCAVCAELDFIQRAVSVEVIRQCVGVIRQCVEVSRQWLELRRLLVDDEGRRERERESEESIYIQKKSGGEPH